MTGAGVPAVVGQAARRIGLVSQACGLTLVETALTWRTAPPRMLLPPT